MKILDSLFVVKVISSNFHLYINNVYRFICDQRVAISNSIIKIVYLKNMDL